MHLITILFCLYIVGTRIVFSKEPDSVNEVKEFDKTLSEEDGIVVLFTQPCCACAECVEAEVLIGGMSQQLEDNLGLIVLRIKDPKIKSRYGIKKVPSLAYIRNNKTALYDDKFEFETLYSWLQDNREPSTVDLDDISFEHLTQAATGATTGDWLVIFHDNICCKKRELIKLENTGIRLKNKVNVASVNIRKAPETAERFKIASCPQVIFFRHQKMYQFTLPEITVKTLRNFADGFYKNSKAESVPPPPSAFDKVLDKTIEFFTGNTTNLLMVMAATTVCTTLFLICAVLKSSSPPSKTKSE